MQRHALARAFVVLWWTLGVVLFADSLRTVVHGLAAEPASLARRVVPLAAFETIAAALFLVARTSRAGGLALLVAFSVAFVLHALRGELAAHLLIYAAAVGFVVAHGPARRSEGSVRHQHA